MKKLISYIESDFKLCAEICKEYCVYLIGTLVTILLYYGYIFGFANALILEVLMCGVTFAIVFFSSVCYTLIASVLRR